MEIKENKKKKISTKKKENRISHENMKKIYDTWAEKAENQKAERQKAE